jgi:Tol biopolymer transport system component
VNANNVLPSPDGQWVATVMNNGIRVNSTTTAANHIYDFADASDYIAWSPDGATLLFSGTVVIPQPNHPVGSPIGILVDVATEQTRTVYPDVPAPCSTCPFELQWLPSGDEIVATPPSRDGLQTVNTDGFAHRMLPVGGSPLGSGAWSPDGSLVIVRSTDETRPTGTQVVKVATGQVVQELDGQALQAQWTDDDRYITWEADGDASSDWVGLMATLHSLDGAVIERWVLPVEIARVGPQLRTGRAPEYLPMLAPLLAHLG